MLLTLSIRLLIGGLFSILYCCGVKFKTWLRILVGILTIILSLPLFRIDGGFFFGIGAIIIALVCFGVNITKGWKIAGCILCGIGIISLISEFFNEYNALQDYTAKVEQEQNNRKDILAKYTERDNNMSSIITLEKNIVDYAKRMLATDCASTKTTCYDADLWNSLSNQMDEAFDEKDRLWNKSKTAISSQNDVKISKDLWILDLLGMNNSEELNDSLESYSSSISSKKASINSKIDQIDNLESDCDYPPVLECKTRYSTLEKER